MSSSIRSLNDSMTYLNTLLNENCIPTETPSLILLEQIKKVVRQAEKIFLGSAIFAAALTANLFIGSVTLLSSSLGVFFLVPLTLSVGSATILVDLVSSKNLAEKIRFLVREFQTFGIQQESFTYAKQHWSQQIEEIKYDFEDLLILPSALKIDFLSIKEFFLSLFSLSLSNLKGPFQDSQSSPATLELSSSQPISTEDSVVKNEAPVSEIKEQDSVANEQISHIQAPELPVEDSETNSTDEVTSNFESLHPFLEGFKQLNIDNSEMSSKNLEAVNEMIEIPIKTIVPQEGS